MTATPLLVLLLTFGQLAFAKLGFSESTSASLQVISSSEFQPIRGVDLQPDGPISVHQAAAGELSWIIPAYDHTHDYLTHMVLRGPTGQPFKSFVSDTPQSAFFKYDTTRYEGRFWIVNTYQADAGLLAFVHVEQAEGSKKQLPGAPYSTGLSRIGLAFSVDGGKSFSYLGHIIIPFGDPDPFNVQGLPYLVIDGFFYIYFHDINGLAVARAPVAEVIDAASKGRNVSWLKYTGSKDGFSSSGLGGASKGLGVPGISHSDAACSTYNGKCYLVMTRMNWSAEDTWVKLFETIDGVSWKQTLTIAKEPASAVVQGYQYATIVNISGEDNGIVGKRFFVYSLKDPGKSARVGYRWEIDLGN